MRPIFVLSLITVLFITYLQKESFAQASEANINDSNAVHFYFINGYAAAYKFKSTGLSSYRLHLDLYSYHTNGTSEGTNDNISIYDTTFRKENNDSKSTNFSIRVSPQYLYRIFSKDLANIYFGGGPFIGYYYYKYSSNSKSNYYSSSIKNSNNSSNTQKTYSIGIAGFIGVEGKITNNVSVFAETQLSGGKNWVEDNAEHKSIYETNESISKSKRTNDYWSFTLTNIRVGVGVYF